VHRRVVHGVDRQPLPLTRNLAVAKKTYRLEIPSSARCDGTACASRLLLASGTMPTYEYECKKCGHRFEIFQPITAAPLQSCPEDLCGRKKWGKGKVKRLVGAGAGLLFKGSGFYITDYRSDSYKSAAKKETEAARAPGPAAGESKSGESKSPSTGSGGTAAAKGAAGAAK